MEKWDGSQFNFNRADYQIIHYSAAWFSTLACDDLYLYNGHLRTVMQRFEYKDSGMKEMFGRWINCSKNNK